MGDNFDWQTEENTREDQSLWEQPEVDPTAGLKSHRRLNWRFLAVLLMVGSVAAAAVWWRVDKRVNEATQALRNDVASSHNLVQIAAAEQDKELFRSVLSGQNPAWTVSQMDLFEAGLLVDRSRFGLDPPPSESPFTIPVPLDETAMNNATVSVTFTPDLNEATIVTAQPYLVRQSNNRPQTVILQQTAVYRQGQQRWLLAPPDETFWGEWLTAESGALAVTFPQRDEAIARQLTMDLDRQIARMCHSLPEINCPSDLRIDLRLESDPASLLPDLQLPIRQPDSPRSLEMPAPTLIGLPLETDEAAGNRAYETLLAVYAEPLLRMAMTQSVGWQCCQQGFMVDVLLDYQLSRLGLTQWPVDEATYQRVIDERLHISDMASMWRRTGQESVPEDNRWQLYVAVDFLMNALPGVSAAEMMRLLPTSANLEVWFSELATADNEAVSNWVVDSLDQAWWIYAQQGTLAPDDLPPVEPDGPFLLACTAAEMASEAQETSAFRYEPALDQWNKVLGVEGFLWISPLPDPTALLLQEFPVISEIWQTSLWRDNLKKTAYITQNGFSISFAEMDPTGRFLITYAWEPEQETTRPLALDLNECDRDGCAAEELLGIPIWSPDGSHSILQGDGSMLPGNAIMTNDRVILFGPGERLDERFVERPLALGPGPIADDPNQLEPLGTGYSPFWIDNETFGYIRLLRPDTPVPQHHPSLQGTEGSYGRLPQPGTSVAVEQEIVLSTVGSDSITPILSSTDFPPILPGDTAVRRLTLGYVAPRPENRRQLFVAALDELREEIYIFLFDLDSQQIDLRLKLAYDLNHSLSFSPDGRYLVVTGRDRPTRVSGEDNGVLYLHNIAQNTTTPFAIRLPFFVSSVSHDWTPDSNWLLIALDDNLLGLVAPDFDYVRPMPHSQGNCTSVAWMGP